MAKDMQAAMKRHEELRSLNPRANRSACNAQCAKSLKKTDYDPLAAAKQILEAGLPMESAMRLLTKSEAAVLVADSVKVTVYPLKPI